MTTIDKFYLASKREAISSIGMACGFGNQCEKDGKAYVEEFEEVSMYDSPEGHMLSQLLLLSCTYQSGCGLNKVEAVF